MTSATIELFNKGILSEAFQATRNILIWQHVADEIVFLKAQDKHVKNLYSFLQQSAQVNYILSLGKLFDKPSNKYPTQCIISFLQQVKADAFNACEIIETTNTKKLLREYFTTTSLINAVESHNKSLFPKLFSEYYLKKYNDVDLQKDIVSLKLLRNKAVAHNEAVDRLYLEFEVTDNLLKFVTEIISVFGMAYQSTVWETEKMSFIRMSAERDAYFVKWNIDSLKK